MIKAKDLMIGNKFSNNGVECHVMKIGKSSAEFGYFEDSIGFMRKFNDRTCPDPIPLKGEWWTMFGYKSFKEFINCLDEKSKIPLADENLEFWAKKLEGFAVHEIQNLYKVLTGEELTMKQ